MLAGWAKLLQSCEDGGLGALSFDDEGLKEYRGKTSLVERILDSSSTPIA